MEEVELKHLRALLAVAEEGNVGRAAQRLGTSQPPLSRLVARVEEHLGVRLFDRTGRGVALTEAGRAYLDEARRVLRLASDAADAARRAAAGRTGLLRLGFDGSSVFDVVPRSVREFRSRLPEVEVAARPVPTAEQPEELARGLIDAGFVLAPAADGRLEAVEVVREPLVAVLPEGHPLASRDPVPARSLAGQPFVFCPPHGHDPLRDAVLGLCRSAGFTPSVALEAREMQFALGAVAAGLGVGVFPGSVRHLVRSGTVVRGLRPAGAGVALAVAWRRGGRTPAVAAFVEVVREIAGS